MQGCGATPGQPSKDKKMESFTIHKMNMTIHKMIMLYDTTTAKVFIDMVNA